MTRHNLAAHLSWLLTSEVTPPEGVHTVPSASAPVLTVSAETLYADSEEEDIEEQNPGPLPPSPSPNRRIATTANVATGFQRPPPPPKIAPNPPTREPAKPFVDESMGRLSSASRSARPGLVSQQQLATPASTTGSTSSLMQGYQTFLTKNCKSKKSYWLIHQLTELGMYRHSLIEISDRPNPITRAEKSTNPSDSQANSSSNSWTQD